MMAEIIPFKCGEIGSGISMPPNEILDRAKDKLREVVVFGYKPDGELYVASSEGPGDTMWLIEAAKLYLLNGAE